MLTGKSWPRAIHGFHMLVVVLLEGFVNDETKTDNIMEILVKARQYPTGRHWVDCFIIPVMIAHIFIRSEREGKWLLHLYCLKRMLPYFMAAGHWDYARYIAWFLQQRLPAIAELPFIMGDHVCRHSDGPWNGISTDQFGEHTYICYDKIQRRTCRHQYLRRTAFRLGSLLPCVQHA